MFAKWAECQNELPSSEVLGVDFATKPTYFLEKARQPLRNGQVRKIHWEAGALAKGLRQSRILTYLFELTYSEVQNANDFLELFLKLRRATMLRPGCLNRMHRCSARR